LRLLDLEHSKTAVLNSLTSQDAQRGYRHAIDEFVDWYCSEPRLAFNRIVVLRYRSHLESRQLAPGTVNLRLGAVRRLAYEAADCGLLSADLAAGIRRVKGVKKLGVRLGNWLTAEQGQALWQAPDCERLKGKRDRAPNAGVLGVIEIFNTYWVTTALCCRLAGESASKIPPMTPKRTTSVKSR
jgi:site-specific recombinase XerD